MDTAQSLSFRRLLTDQFKRGATDLHYSVGSRPTVRIHGSLEPVEVEQVITDTAIRDLTNDLLSAEEQSRLAKEKDFVATRVFDDRIRAKIHIFHQEGQLSVSFRFLSHTPKTLRELNIPSDFEKFLTQKEGLLIITGGYGSGRTTLAAGFLEEINRTRVAHIMTIEKPIEYNLVSNKSIIDQREVGVDVADCSTALQFAAEEDVDVLFVSDMPNLDAVRRVLELAGAGMFVIAVMNSDSAVRALEKLITTFESHHQQHIQGLLADVLVAVITQELVPSIGGGVVPVHELLLNDASIKAMLVSGRLQQLEQVIKSSRAQGMMSFDHELAKLVRNQRISRTNALDLARDRSTLDTLLRAH